MADVKQLFVVGVFVEETENGSVWDIKGIFDDEYKAVANCLTDKHFVGPLPLNTPLPEERIVWPDVYYPLVAASKCDVTLCTNCDERDICKTRVTGKNFLEPTTIGCVKEE